MPESTTKTTRRQRLRERTVEEILEIALRQLTESGAGAISIKAIAGELGMTGPAIYRYFPNRDSLITALVVQGYRDFGAALQTSADESGGLAPAERVRRQAHAYRAWALANPQRYLLLFGTPVPGYHAPVEETQPAAMQLFMAGLDLTIAEAALGGEDIVETPAEQSLGAWAREHELDLPGIFVGQLFSGWTRLHGVISLELAGHFAFGLPGPELLYEIEIASLVADLERAHRGSA